MYTFEAREDEPKNLPEKITLTKYLKDHQKLVRLSEEDGGGEVFLEEEIVYRNVQRPKSLFFTRVTSPLPGTNGK